MAHAELRRRPTQLREMVMQRSRADRAADHRRGAGRRRRRPARQGQLSIRRRPTATAGSATSRSSGTTSSTSAAWSASVFNTDLVHQRRLARARTGRHLGRAGRLVLTMLVTLVLSFPLGVGAGDLSRGVRAEEPLDRPDRGQHQQSGGGAVDRVRPAGPRGVHQLLRPAALGAAGRRPGAGADELPTIIIATPRRAASGAAVDPRGGARASARRRCRWCSTTCCRWRCPAC